MVQRKGFSRGDEEVCKSTLFFGPLPGDTVERMREVALGETAAGESPVADRLGTAIASLPAACGFAAAGEADAAPFLLLMPEGLEVSSWSDPDADDDVYVWIELIGKPARAFDVCGLKHQLMVLEIDFRIEDEWTLPAREELLLVDWHRGMGKPLVRRGVRDAGGDVMLRLGWDELRAVYSSGRDAVERDGLISDYFVLGPTVGKELHGGELPRLNRLAASLSGGAYSDELPLLAGYETEAAVDGSLLYVSPRGNGSRRVDEVDSSLLRRIDDALQSDLIEDPLNVAGIDFADARWILDHGPAADKRKLFEAVVEAVVIFGADGAAPLEPVRIRWRVPADASCPCRSGNRYADCCGT
jgi:hypothetical protein